MPKPSPRLTLHRPSAYARLARAGIALAALALSACGGGVSVVSLTTPGTSAPAGSVTTTLRASVPDLALSVSGLVEYGVAGAPSSGSPRSITITNTGSVAASALAVSPGTLPAGTSVSSSCGASLPAGASCSITVVPGPTASSDGSQPCTAGTAPLGTPITVSAGNSASVSVPVRVLGYGCVEQGGYVYALDDSAPGTASVGGKVLSLLDQDGGGSGLLWSSDGLGASASDVANDALYGIDDLSMASTPSPSAGQGAGQVACDGSADGACDSANITAYYEADAPFAPVNAAYYAAGACTAVIAGHADWYLPAICEMGYDNTSAGTGCGSASSPRLQSVQANLVDTGAASLLNGTYWSATEYAANAANLAWLQTFGVSGTSGQQVVQKSGMFHVRCARRF